MQDFKEHEQIIKALFVYYWSVNFKDTFENVENYLEVDNKSETETSLSRNLVIIGEPIQHPLANFMVESKSKPNIKILGFYSYKMR